MGTYYVNNYSSSDISENCDVEINSYLPYYLFSYTYNIISPNELTSTADVSTAFINSDLSFVTDEDNLSELLDMIFQYNDTWNGFGNHANLILDTSKEGTRTDSRRNDDNSKFGPLYEKARGSTVGYDFVKYMNWRKYGKISPIGFTNTNELREKVNNIVLYSIKYGILNGSIEGGIPINYDTTYNSTSYEGRPGGQLGAFVQNTNNKADLKGWIIENTIDSSNVFINWLPDEWKEGFGPYSLMLLDEPGFVGLDETTEYDNKGKNNIIENARVLYPSPCCETLFHLLMEKNPERFNSLELLDNKTGGPYRYAVPIEEDDKIIMKTTISMAAGQIDDTLLDNKRAYNIIFNQKHYSYTQVENPPSEPE